MKAHTARARASDAPATPFEPVLRPRVIERLRQAAQRRITLVVAPAGFGKSVAIRQYLETYDVEHLRFSVRKEHDSLVGFLRGLVGALEPIAPKASKSVAGAYEKASRGATPVRDLAAWVSALLARYHGTVVIDDLHFAVGDSRVLGLVSELIAFSSADTRWILSTRSPLSLPYASWLAYGLMDDPIDEMDLALTLDEAGDAVNSASTNPLRLAERLLNETKGWPAAFMFGLRALNRVGEQAISSPYAREVLYNYLAHQVMKELPETERSFMLQTCVLSSIDAQKLETGGLVGARSILQSLRSKAAFITIEGDHQYRYHELFREFLEHELRSAGPLEFEHVVGKLARVVEQTGDLTTALELYVRIGEHKSITRLLEHAGPELFMAGHLECIDSALNCLREEDVCTATLLLNARLKTAHGFDRDADLLYERAMAVAAVDEKAHVVWRYAAYLSRKQKMGEALTIIDSVAPDTIVPSGSRALLLGIRASLLSCFNEIEHALVEIDRALKCLTDADDQLTRVTIYSYASFVNLKAHKLDTALVFAKSCLEGALRIANFELAAITCTQLYNLALDLGDDQLAGSALETMLSSASQAGDLRIRGIAIMNMFDRAGMRGDESELTRLTSDVMKFHERDPKTWSECVAPTLALQAAWRGEFTRAFAFLSSAERGEFNAGQEVLRLAELAFYGAAAREPALSLKAREFVAATLEAMSANRELAGARIRRARLMVELAQLILGENPNRRGVTDGQKWMRLRRQLREFSEHEYGGWFRAIDAAVSESSSDIASPLTVAEQQVLSLIAEGRTSREVAECLGRSVLTVDTHGRSAIRKLGVPNRRDAIRRSRDMGLI